MWVADCHQPNRPNRAALFNAELRQAGCGVESLNRDTFTTCVLTANFFFRTLNKDALTAARVPLGPYTAEVASASQYNSVISHKADEYTHSADLAGRSPEEVFTSNGVLGDLKSDNSVKCPDYVNPSLRTNVVRDWKLVSASGCKRGEGNFKSADNIFGNAPFAKNGKCY